jgi:hypothetical protein
MKANKDNTTNTKTNGTGKTNQGTNGTGNNAKAVDTNTDLGSYKTFEDKETGGSIGI